MGLYIGWGEHLTCYQSLTAGCLCSTGGSCCVIVRTPVMSLGHSSKSSHRYIFLLNASQHKSLEQTVLSGVLYHWHICKSMQTFYASDSFLLIPQSPGESFLIERLPPVVGPGSCTVSLTAEWVLRDRWDSDRWCSRQSNSMADMWGRPVRAAL